MSNPAPGWYPDPSQSGGLRWWDGSQWTGSVSAYPTAPAAAGWGGPDIDAERGTAKWAKRGLVAMLLGQLAGLASVSWFFTTIDDVIREIDAGTTTGRTANEPPLGLVLTQPLTWLSVAGIVAIVIWTYRSGQNAERLGYRLPRSPGITAASFFIPIVNFWWPYQGIKALLPPGDRARSHVAWWFGTYLAGSLAAIPAGALIAFGPLPIGVLAAALVGLVGVAMVVHGRAMIDAVVAAHQEAVSLRSR